MEFRNRYNALLAAYCLDSNLRVGRSCSTFSSPNSGLHLGHPLPFILLPSVITTCVEMHCPLIQVSLSFSLLTLTVFFFRRCRLSVEIYLDKSSTSTWSRVPCWCVEDRRLSSFPLPLSPGSSWISRRDPIVVVLYCNSPDFTKIKNFVFGVNCLIV